MALAGMWLSAAVVLSSLTMSTPGVWDILKEVACHACPPNETMNASLKRQAPRVWISAASTLGDNEGKIGWSCKQAIALQWLVFAGAVISVLGVGMHIFILTIRMRVRYMMRGGMKDEEKLVGGPNSERVTYGTVYAKQ
jgi:hypothetical protein